MVNADNTGQSANIGFAVKLNYEFPEKWSQYVKVRWHQLKDLLMLGIRYFFYWLYIKSKGRTPLMDYMNVVTGQQIYGVPLGGIGCGTIGRGFKGEFCRYQLRPGIYYYQTISGNQFIVTVRNTAGETVYQKVLTSTPKPKTLKAWDWTYNGGNADFLGLYPRSWTTFRIPEENLVLTCRQISPVIPHNYTDSCLPCAVFVWTVENNSKEEKTVSIAMTFQNGIGDSSDTSPGAWTEAFTFNEEKKETEGVLIHHKVKNMEYTFALAACKDENTSYSFLTEWKPSGAGDDVWNPLKENGNFSTVKNPQRSQPTKKGQLIGSAICKQVTSSPSGVSSFEFALAWDMPKVHFEEHEKEYFRFYTRKFGRDGQSGPAIASFALHHYVEWENAISEWQDPVLKAPNLPDWYKSALFNETYYISDGGSVWLDIEDNEDMPANDPRREFGRFAYLEGHEYRMYNTYDVHYYASFALAMNWPKLQAVLQRDFADAIPKEDPSRQWHLFDGDICQRKKKNSIPHDLGDPGEEPFLKINAYPIHDVSEWRDLNLKYVLQVCRDYCLTKDIEELKVHWPYVLLLMRNALKWDSDGDGMIENHGSADQTYDTWIMTGTSAYCGSLWLAALQMTCYMASIMDSSVIPEFAELLKRAKAAFEKKLWNGRYYSFDSSDSDHSKSIMSDQLCGLWYLLCCGLPNQIIPEENARSALQTIFNFNVKKFGNGEIGAVNGMMPNGKPDTFTVQSEEMWSGVVYAYSALLLLHGMDDQAFSTAGGLYKLVYEKIGLGYQTPEALYEKNCYRSIAYMRPLSIWSMQLALQLRK